MTSPFLYPIAVAVSALTTLFTPVPHPWVRRDDRRPLWLAPRSVVNYVNLYSRWMSKRARGARARRARVEELLAVGAPDRAERGTGFGGARRGVRVARDVSRVRHPATPPLDRRRQHDVWVGAMILVLPLMIVSIRKLRSTAIVGSEMMVKASRRRADDAERSAA